MRVIQNLISALIFLLGSCSPARDILTFADGAHNQSGYIDTNGKWVIKPSGRFGNKYQFTERCAAVCVNSNLSINQKWGFINRRGVYFIKPIYEDASPFLEGMAGVRLNNKWGYINKKGKVLINFQFEYAHPFKKNYATVKVNNLWGLINKNGEYLIPPVSECPLYFENDSSLSLYELNGLYGFINLHGKEIIKPIYGYANNFSEGLASVSNSAETVFINTKGEVVIAGKFKHSWGFREGLAAVEIGYRRVIYINKLGENVFRKEWESADDFRDGYAIIMVNNQYTIINKTGTVITKPKDNYLSYIGRGFFSIGTTMDTVINASGKVIWAKE